MLITNKSTVTITLDFIPLTLAPNQSAEVPDSYRTNPTLIRYLDSNLISIDEDWSTSTVTLTGLIGMQIEEHTSDTEAHHSSKYNLSSEEKAAVSMASGAGSSNPFETEAGASQKVTAGLAQHVIAYPHNPPSLTSDEVDSIHAGTALTGSNPVTSLSHASGLIAAAVGAHAATPTAHHSNINDSTANQKAALDANSVLDATHPVAATTDIVTHAAIATAHHTNANDPTAAQKAALDANVALSGSNKVIDDSDARLLTADEKAGVAGATGINASNIVVLTNDPRVSTSFHLTPDWKDALTHSTPAATTSAYVITQGNTSLLNANERAALTAASSPTGSNAVATVADITAHAGIATAHHSNTNDPTSNQKAALTAASTLSSSDAVAAISDITTHAGIATAHHSNTNDPTSDQKAALDANSGLSASNRVVDNASFGSHGSSHVSGGNVIPTVTSSASGIVTPAILSAIAAQSWDIRLTRTSATELSLLAYNVYIDGNFYTTSSAYTVTTSINVLASDGTDSGATPAVSTTYAVYMSASTASVWASSLRLSTTMPTGYYNQLGTSGEALKWRCVGYARTNGSTEFATDLSIISLGETFTSMVVTGTGTQACSNPSTTELISGFSVDVIYPKEYTIESMANIDLKIGTTGDVKLYLNWVLMEVMQISDVAHYHRLNGIDIATHTSSTPAVKTISIEAWWESSSSSDCDKSGTKLTIKRIKL